MGTILRIALRNVLRNRRRTLITLAALLVGVSVMITIRGLLNGFQEATVLSVVDGQTGALQVHRKGYMKNVLSSPLRLDLEVDDALFAKIRAVPGVKAVSARIQFAGMISTGNDTLFFSATGIDPQREFEVCPLRRASLEGPFGASPDGIALTREFAKSVRLAPGTEGALLAPDRDGALNGENVHFVASLPVDFSGDRKAGLVPLALAQRLLRMEGRATELVVAIDDVAATPQVAAALAAALGPAFEVNTWADVANFVQQQQARQNVILQLIAGVFMVLMLLGVANTMLMSVLERTREIGTLMAVGLRRSRILALFLVEAAGLGVLGAAVGVAAGFVVVTVLRTVGLSVTAPGQSVPFVIRPHVSAGYLAVVLVAASLGAVLFALYPALRASRLRPVEALAGR